MNKSDYEDFDFEDYKENTNSFDFEPQKMDRDTFELRTDPSNLLKRYKLQLMNAYIRQEEQVDKKGTKKTITKIYFKKHTTPKANSQGVEDIINYVEKLINNHTVQGNIESVEQFRNLMRCVSNDLTIHFIVKREDWGIKENDIDFLIVGAINLIELFLTRTLFNEERKGYGETYKETTNRDIKQKEKKSLFERIGSFVGWKN